MIIETIVTTLNEDNSVNIAPMGPRIDSDWSRFELRPFADSTTYANLQRSREGVVHITDDVLMLARAAVGVFDGLPDLVPGAQVQVPAIRDACRWYEFRVDAITETPPRHQVHCRTVQEHRNREFSGFNRAKHAVVEAAILITRLHLIPVEEIREEFQRFQTIVEKTGGSQEKAAFAFLKNRLPPANQVPLSK